MRKKFAIFQVSPRRLLSLLLLQFFFTLAVPYVDDTLEIHTINLNNSKDTLTGGKPLIRTHTLAHRCSGDKFVQMFFGKTIVANGTGEGPFTEVDFESAPHGGVRIKGKTIRKYLCFRRKGSLTLRTHISPKNRAKCTFNEKPKNGFIELQSVANNQWYVGFNKRGKKLKGFAVRNKRRRRTCFRFTKMTPHKKRHSRHKMEHFNTRRRFPNLDRGNR